MHAWMNFLTLAAFRVVENLTERGTKLSRQLLWVLWLGGELNNPNNRSTFGRQHSFVRQYLVWLRNNDGRCSGSPDIGCVVSRPFDNFPYCR